MFNLFYLPFHLSLSLSLLSLHNPKEFVVVVPEDHPMLKLTFVPTVLTLSKSNESGVMEAATDVISGLVSAVGSAIVGLFYDFVV